MPRELKIQRRLRELEFDINNRQDSLMDDDEPEYKEPDT